MRNFLDHISYATKGLTLLHCCAPAISKINQSIKYLEKLAAKGAWQRVLALCMRLNKPCNRCRNDCVTPSRRQATIDELSNYLVSEYLGRVGSTATLT
jgi:hypothetical protein